MGPRTENAITIAVTAFTLVTLYWLGAGGWSFSALIFLINLNVITEKQ